MSIHELFAYICVDDCNKAIEFYTNAFGATEKFRLTEPSGRVGHAEVDFGGMTLMLSDAFPARSATRSVTAGTSGTSSKSSTAKRCSADTTR